MKNQQPPGKDGGVSSKRPSSSSSGGRNSRWESNSERPSSDQSKKPAADPKPSATPKEDRSSGGLPGNTSQPAGRHPLPSPAGAPPFLGGQEGPAGGGGGGIAPPPPAYGFHMLERRTIVLADGSVRSYFALPPDQPLDPGADRFLPYGVGGRGPPMTEHGLGLGHDRHYPHPPPPGGHLSPDSFRQPPLGRPGGPPRDYWGGPMGLDGPRGPQEGLSSLKRKYGEEDEYALRRQHVMQYGSAAGLNTNGFPGERPDYLGRPGSPLRRDYLDDDRLSKHARVGGDGYDDRRGRGDGDVPPAALDVDPKALKRAFLKYVKSINDSVTQRKNYLEDGKNGPLSCLACGRSSKEFADVHQLIMHTYISQNADLRTDHLGLHKALCVLMGWNYAKEPENSKAYQSLSAKDAEANREDLILWPPCVIIHNTSSGKRKDGRVEGMGNKEMDGFLREIGFGSGKAKSMYGKEGHLGITLVKFASTEAGLKEAVRCAEYFEKDNHGREGWARAQASHSSRDNDQNPLLVKANENGEEKRILYGYLAVADDLSKIEFDLRKKLSVRSRRDPDFV